MRGDAGADREQRGVLLQRTPQGRHRRHQQQRPARRPVGARHPQPLAQDRGVTARGRLLLVGPLRGLLALPSGFLPGAYAVFGKGQRGHRGEHARQDAAGGDQRIAAHGEHRGGHDRGRHDGAGADRAGAAHDRGVAAGRAQAVELGVDQRLQRARLKRSGGAPQHEAHGEHPVGGGRDPQAEAGGGQQRRQGEQRAPRDDVGPHPGGDLQRDGGDRPDRQERGDLGGRQTRVDEQ